MIRELLGAEATHNLWEHEDIFPVLPGDLIHLSLRPYLLKVRPIACPCAFPSSPRVDTHNWEDIGSSC